MKKYIDKINKILEDAQAERTECTDRMKSAKAAAAAAEEEMQAALNADKDAAYIKAKQSRDIAQDKFNAAMIRLEELDSKPLITKEEYETLMRGIIRRLEEICDADKKEVLSLGDKIVKIAERNGSTIDDGNVLLSRLQIDVYRAADCERLPSGAVLGQREFRDRNSLLSGVYPLFNTIQYNSIKAPTKSR